MTLAEYLDKHDRKALAEQVGVVDAYLYQIATDRRKASPKLARRISEATNGMVTLAELRPDVWGDEED